MDRPGLHLARALRIPVALCLMFDSRPSLNNLHAAQGTCMRAQGARMLRRQEVSSSLAGRASCSWHR